jgi:hypothetical protein
MKRNEKGEITELSHDPWPGFKPAFLVMLTVSVLYLATILYNSFQQLGH